MVSVKVSCPIFPSEDPDRVIAAVNNIFPEIELERSENRLSGTATEIRHFYNKIRKQKILDATRAVLFKGKRGNTTTFNLNKQAAFVQKISFVEEKTVLGTIRVTVEADDIEAFIEDIAPNTVDGVEVRI